MCDYVKVNPILMHNCNASIKVDEWEEIRAVFGNRIQGGRESVWSRFLVKRK